MSVTGRDYFLRRERQERDLATKAVDPRVAAIHRQMADYYEGLAARSEPAARPEPRVRSKLRIAIA